MKEIRDAVEWADKELYTIDKYGQDEEMRVLHGERFQKAINAIKTFKDLAKKVLAVGSKMPRKDTLRQSYEDEAGSIFDGIRNQAIDDCTLAFASMGLSIEELREEIYDHVKDGDYSIDSVASIDSLATALHKAWEGKVRG